MDDATAVGTSRDERSGQIGRLMAWQRIGCEPAVVRPSTPAAIVIETILAAIDHVEDLVRGRSASTIADQIGSIYIVPFPVSTTSSAAAIQRQRVGGEHESAVLE